MASTAEHPNAQLIQRFYAAFGALDGPTMAACYAHDAVFTDPVFGELRGDEPGRMWVMLTQRAQDLVIRLESYDADERHGSAHWLADYTFAATGRKVHNDVRAEFTFDRDGLISTHDDVFSFHNWARQALGPTGLLFGWAPPLQKKVRSQARAGLAVARDAGT